MALNCVFLGLVVSAMLLGFIEPIQGGFCNGKANGNYADPNNCHGYIACSNGFLYKMPCPANLKFNEKTNRCEYNAPCRSGGFCNGKANGNYADPNNCHGYIACSNGFLYKMPCPANLKFNEKTNRCEYNAPCPSACGRKPAEGRIIGGEEAPRNSWPWQALLRLDGSLQCGASLLSTTWLLTAAHCVNKVSDPNRYSVVLGAHNRIGDGEEFQVSRVIHHPQFSMSHLRHDVAVLKLSRPATLGRKVGTVCLPAHGSRVSEDAICYVTGWGRIDPNNLYLPSDVLKQALAPVVSYDQCRNTNGGTVDESSMVCVGGRGSSVCNGDSGGPLSCLEGGKWVVRGAASWVTSKTCPGNTYSVYARVSSYVNWINGYVQSS